MMYSMYAATIKDGSGNVVLTIPYLDIFEILEIDENSYGDEPITLLLGKYDNMERFINTVRKLEIKNKFKPQPLITLQTHLRRLLTRCPEMCVLRTEKITFNIEDGENDS